jgi:GNAT superfamily N-acetyltransferase
MLERWFSTIRLPLSTRQFNQLPQNPAYTYEYCEDTAWLTPRPKFYNARLELRARPRRSTRDMDGCGSVGFRRFEQGDWARLARLFAGAFQCVQPFASLSGRRGLNLARTCLKFTREGGDGPVLGQACHVAFSKETEQCLGAVLVTLIPPVDIDGSWSLRWKTPPPDDCIESRLGRPHLTWIFVGPKWAGQGIGTELLAEASTILMKLGYTELVSSFLLGNTSSMLWHWRTGFELLPYMGSWRAMRARIGKTNPRPHSSS